MSAKSSGLRKLPNLFISRSVTVSDKTDTRIKKDVDILLNRCAHNMMSVIHSTLNEHTFNGAEEASFRDVCDIIKASFYRNKIPENEWPNFLQEGIQFPKNFDEAETSILLEKGVMGCLKKRGTLHIYLQSSMAGPEIEKKIKDLLVKHDAQACEPVFKYITMEYFHSSGDRACNGTLGGFAIKKANVAPAAKEGPLVALISRHVAIHNINSDLLVGPNQTNLGRIYGMKFFDNVDIFPVQVEEEQRRNCDTKFKTEKGIGMCATLRKTSEIETLQGSIVHIWGKTTSPGLGIVVERPLKTPNGKIIFVRDRNPGRPFSAKGDSGGMVCYYDPIDEVLYAVGMLIGGCKADDAHSYRRYAAQVVDDGRHFRRSMIVL